MTTPSKRDRLIEVAKVIFYQQRVTHSTLADIAQPVQVPLDNVYYHFRTYEISPAAGALKRQTSHLFKKKDS